MANNQYTLYWRWDTVQNEMDWPLRKCRHAHSNQLSKVSEGDILWIVTVGPESAHGKTGHLFLAARLQVGFCTNDKNEAARLLGTDDFWEAAWHVGAASGTAEPFKLVDISDVASELRFASQQDCLLIMEGKVNPQQFQSMRLLTSESAALVQTLWQEARAREEDEEYGYYPRFVGPPLQVDYEYKEMLERLNQAIENDDLQYPEGRQFLVEHLKRERNKSLVRAAKRAFFEKHERLFCEVCDFDFSTMYGDLGQGYIEAHHTIPVSQLHPGATTRIEDLAMVCANCHRMLHASDPLLGVEGLRALLQKVRDDNG